MVDKFTSISILSHVVSYMDTGEIEVYNTLHKYLEVEPSYRSISCSSTPVCRDMIWLVKIWTRPWFYLCLQVGFPAFHYNWGQSWSSSDDYLGLSYLNTINPSILILERLKYLYYKFLNCQNGFDVKHLFK